ncbi:MAG: oligosaccharide flippase family protein [Desulfobacteraceae bacterium]|nr:oligosaccharide flippase family protein [Desulfobacteraceae bacterium]
MLVVFLCSPLIAHLYHEPKIIPLLKLFSLTFLISGLSILQQAILQRDLAFDKLAQIEIIATLFASMVGIGSAVAGYGAFSLVYQSLALATVMTILLWRESNWRPILIFNLAEVKAISSYSLNLTGFGIFNYFIRNADNLIIGRYLGAQNLGYYDLAYRLMLYPLSISGVIGRVMFSVYAQIQDDDAKFRRIYLKVASSIALITFPMMLGLMVIAEPFVLAILALSGHRLFAE